MRSFCPFVKEYWFEDVKHLEDLGANTNDLMLATYLQGCPTSTMIGVYYITIEEMAKYTFMTLEGASESLSRLIQAGYIFYDYNRRYVWVVNMIIRQLGENLKEKDKRVIGANSLYLGLPKLTFIGEFYKKYKEILYLTEEREAPTEPLEGPSKQVDKLISRKVKSKQVRSHISISAQHAAPKKEKKSEFLTLPENVTEPVQRLFDYWVAVMKRTDVKLTQDRVNLIESALSVYSEQDIAEAILGCSRSPFYMGANASNNVVNDFKNIFKDSSTFDGFRAKGKGEVKTKLQIDEENMLAEFRDMRLD